MTLDAEGIDARIDECVRGLRVVRAALRYSRTLRSQFYYPNAAEAADEVDVAIRKRIQAVRNTLAEMLVPDTADPAADYAYTPRDRDENGETDIERARRLNDEQEAEPDDVDDEPPPDYGPPGSGAVVVEYVE